MLRTCISMSHVAHLLSVDAGQVKAVSATSVTFETDHAHMPCSRSLVYPFALQIVTHLCYSDFEDILPAIDGLEGAKQFQLLHSTVSCLHE